jgi:hypothetical protein
MGVRRCPALTVTCNADGDIGAVFEAESTWTKRRVARAFVDALRACSAASDAARSFRCVLRR